MATAGETIIFLAQCFPPIPSENCCIQCLEHNIIIQRSLTDNIAFPFIKPELCICLDKDTEVINHAVHRF